jgi:hypothetical protein
MRIGASLLLIAIGAILKFAVTKHVNGIDLQTVGVVLMVVGAVGLVLTLILMSVRRRTDVVVHRNGTTYVEPADPAEPRY